MAMFWSLKYVRMALKKWWRYRSVYLSLFQWTKKCTKFSTIQSEVHIFHMFCWVFLLHHYVTSTVFAPPKLSKTSKSIKRDQKNNSRNCCNRNHKKPTNHWQNPVLDAVYGCCSCLSRSNIRRWTLIWKFRCASLMWHL